MSLGPSTVAVHEVDDERASSHTVFSSSDLGRPQPALQRAAHRVQPRPGQRQEESVACPVAGKPILNHRHRRGGRHSLGGGRRRRLQDIPVLPRVRVQLLRGLFGPGHDRIRALLVSAHAQNLLAGEILAVELHLEVN